MVTSEGGFKGQAYKTTCGVQEMDKVTKLVVVSIGSSRLHLAQPRHLMHTDEK